MSALDFDARQYRVLLGLLGSLGARRELTSQLGLSQEGRLVGPFLAFFGGLFSLIALGHPPAYGFTLGILALTIFFLIPTMVSEATDAFMNPAEASVLAHRPIRGSTYAAAKVTYVIRASLVVALPLNACPSLAGLLLPGTRWFYPLTHLAAAAVTAVFTALVACGGFGALFRIVPVARLRTAALWMQIVAVTAMPILPQLMRIGGGGGSLNAPFWSALPIAWFATLALAGQPGNRPLIWWLAAPVALASIGLVAMGATALSQKYMTRVVMLMRVRRARTGRRTASRRAAIGRLLPGRPGARAAAAFVTKMAMRDWQFRRTFLQANVGIVVLVGVSIVRGRISSPISSYGAPGVIQMVPHLDGIVLASVCQMLASTDYYRAAWVFLTVPSTQFKAFTRGMFWAIWAWLAAVPHAVLLGFGVWRWGLRDGLLFSAYSLAVTSFYLGLGFWLVGGLPFTKPPRPARSTSTQGIVFALLILAGILVAIQAFFILRSPLVTLVATAVFALAAVGSAWMSVRIVNTNILLGLDTTAAGPLRMFAATRTEAD